jgi:hypothetical protein
MNLVRNHHCNELKNQLLLETLRQVRVVSLMPHLHSNITYQHHSVGNSQSKHRTYPTTIGHPALTVATSADAEDVFLSRQYHLYRFILLA